MRQGTYRCEARSVAGFVQQLAVSYLKNKYFLYVRGEVPDDKDPRAVDEKLIFKYDIGLSKWSKRRRHLQGQAKLQYLRHDRTFLLLSTVPKDDSHPFFAEEGQESIKDARESPIHYFGYSVGYRGGHAHVRISEGRYERLKAEFLDNALSSSVEELTRMFRSLPFEPFAPVRQQYRKLLWRVNEVRKASGLPRVPFEALRLKRRSIRPFEDEEADQPDTDGDDTIERVQPTIELARDFGEVAA